MRAVVLAGGLGIRLRPYTAVLPKPLMPVGDRPLLDIIVRQLKRAGCSRITISTGYLAELIEVFFGAGEKYGVSIDYFRETKPLGTVGSLALIEDVDDDDVLVMNGDIITDLDYAKMWTSHCATDAVATIATRVQEVEISLGVPEIADGDATRITGFVEKPRLTYQASMGVFCMSPRALSYITPGEPLNLPDLVLRLIAQGEIVRAWPSTDYWLDIGQHEDYETALAEFERMKHRLLPSDD